MESELPQERQESTCLSVPTDTQVKEASVKKLKFFCLAILALSLVATPALAQKGNRSNKGGAVSAENKKSDKDRDPSPTKGSKAKKTRTRKGWSKNAEHNAKGHSK